MPHGDLHLDVYSRVCYVIDVLWFLAMLKHWPAPEEALAKPVTGCIKPKSADVSGHCLPLIGQPSSEQIVLTASAVHVLFVMLNAAVWGAQKLHCELQQTQGS